MEAFQAPFSGIWRPSLVQLLAGLLALTAAVSLGYGAGYLVLTR
jgi:hypothetical protein